MKKPAMKKPPMEWPRPKFSILDFNKDSAKIAIDLAEYDRDYSLLAQRLRDGRACKEEMKIAADLLEGKDTRKQGRITKYRPVFKDQEIYHFIYLATEELNLPMKAAIEDARTQFGLSRSEIYAAMKRYNEALRKFRVAQE